MIDVATLLPHIARLTIGMAFGAVAMWAYSRFRPDVRRTIRVAAVGFLIGVSGYFLAGAFVTLSWLGAVDDSTSRLMMVWTGLSAAFLTALSSRLNA